MQTSPFSLRFSGKSEIVCIYWLYSNTLSFIVHSAFFTFMSALSGTGYEDTLSPYVPGDGLVIAHLNNNASYPGTLTLPMKVREHKAFADHWSRFKKSLFSCSELSLSPVEPKIGGAGGALLARDSKKEKKRLLNMGCVKERLALVVSPPSRRSASTKIAREERVFAVSLNTIPRSGTEKEE